MIKVFPQKLEAMTEDLRKVEAMLSRERAQLEETESWRKKQEQEMADEEAQLIKAKQRSQLVKNAREHMANERELEATRRMTQEREAEVGRLTDAVENAKKSIAQHEADFAALQEHVAKEAEAAQQKISELEGQIGQEKQLREVAAGRVEPSVLKKYAAIRMRRGLAMAPVKNGTCQGCNMNIPPQLFNILQRGNSIELCGNCNRIVYWDKLLEDPDGKPAEPAPAKEPS
jgi:predicted  nucleic acid-binding Zn-ribbon protein